MDSMATVPLNHRPNFSRETQRHAHPVPKCQLQKLPHAAFRSWHTEKWNLLAFQKICLSIESQFARSPQEQVTNLPAALQQANPATRFKTSRFAEKDSRKQVNHKASAHGKFKTLRAAPAMLQTIPALCHVPIVFHVTIKGEQTPRCFRLGDSKTPADAVGEASSLWKGLHPAPRKHTSDCSAKWK